VSATYDDQDRLLTYGTWTFTYTANGELETKTNTATSETWMFQYDAFGNLVTVGLPNSDIVEYLVDGMGRRVGREKNGVLDKQWIYRDALKPVAELDGAGNLVSEFVYASKTNVPDYVVRNGVTYRVISDHLGSPRRVVNVSNSSDVPFAAEYTSFGDVTGAGLEWMPFGYAGGHFDSDTRLVRFGVRDYAPTVGRWASKEPLRFGGDRNFYVYAFNNPLKWRDPTGLNPVPGSGGASGRDRQGGSHGTSSTGEPQPFNAYIPGWCGTGWNEPFVPEGFLWVDWSEACREHDFCYGECGSDKAVCDENLDRGITSECSGCGPVGDVYQFFVETKAGENAYSDAQADCVCQ
jgi:RHS repeat-associated protein